ncbi:hypothetical protein [Rubritepida flocculans]|mgnify:CR=1 FL=1|uniref:hypothetical protein n=1 Tax=Rubritepida flocculans TaxID=182403 RepID=UPI00040FE769|nr:hypothetical protein [Rubritepida flocculans]
MRALAALLLLLAAPAAAQVPICNALREGMTACFDGRLCVCRFQPGGQLTARPDGHRWDCGPLRPDCRPPPATLDAPHKPPWPQFIPPPQLWLEPPRPPPERPR